MTNDMTTDPISAKFERAMSLEIRLETLRNEHRQIHDTIVNLGEYAYEDELVLHRLKKQKLMVRDRISLIERMLDPAERA